MVAGQLTQVRPARPEVSMASIQCRGQSRVGEGLRLVSRLTYLCSVESFCGPSLDAYVGGPWVTRRLVTDSPWLALPQRRGHPRVLLTVLHMRRDLFNEQCGL